MNIELFARIIAEAPEFTNALFTLLAHHSMEAIATLTIILCTISVLRITKPDSHASLLLTV